MFNSEVDYNKYQDIEQKILIWENRLTIKF